MTAQEFGQLTATFCIYHFSPQCDASIWIVAGTGSQFQANTIGLSFISAAKTGCDKGFV